MLTGNVSSLKYIGLIYKLVYKSSMEESRQARTITPRYPQPPEITVYESLSSPQSQKTVHEKVSHTTCMSLVSQSLNQQVTSREGSTKQSIATPDLWPTLYHREQTYQELANDNKILPDHSLKKSNSYQVTYVNEKSILLTLYSLFVSLMLTPTQSVNRCL